MFDHVFKNNVKKFEYPVFEGVFYQIVSRLRHYIVNLNRIVFEKYEYQKKTLLGVFAIFKLNYHILRLHMHFFLQESYFFFRASRFLESENEMTQTVNQ